MRIEDIKRDLKHCTRFEASHECGTDRYQADALIASQHFNSSSSSKPSPTYVHGPGKKEDFIR